MRRCILHGNLTERVTELMLTMHSQALISQTLSFILLYYRPAFKLILLVDNRIMMKRANLSGLVEQLQRQNQRLKSELVFIRKQLNTFQNKMMDELTKLDPTKIIYDSPLKCLDAFLHQLATITSEYARKNTNLEQIQLKNRQLQHKYQLTQERALKHADTIKQLQGINRDLQRMKDEGQAKLKEDVMQIAEKNQAIKQSYSDLQKRMQLKEISIEQQKRVAVSAIVHHSKKEMLEFRQHLENEFLNQTIKLRDEIKEKDDKIKNLIKGLLKYDKGEKITVQEIGEMKELVKYIGDIQELNNTINQLKDDNFAVKRELKDTLNRKSAADIKSLQLRNQISNLLLKGEKKDMEVLAMEELVLKTREQLKAEKESTKKLQHYFEEKWHNQFQKVKQHLQKVYNEKISDHEKDLQGKKAEISRKVESYIFLHNEDQKIIVDLKQRIEQLHQDMREMSNLIRTQRTQMIDMLRQADETNQMVNEQISSYIYQWSLRILEKDEQVAQLKEELSQTSFNKESYEVKTIQITKSLKNQFQEEKQAILDDHADEIQQLLRRKQQQLQKERKRFQEIIEGMRRQQDYLKTQHQFQIAEVKLRLNKEIEKMAQDLQQEHKNQQQFIAASELREKSLKKEMQDLKQYYMKKITDLEKEIDNKKATLKVVSVKSQNDEDLKKELRMMIEEKISQCRQLIKEKEDLENELQAKESQINHLNHQNTGLRLTKDDWLQIILEVRDEFLTDLAAIDENHWRQLQIFKSKIWELQNVIAKRPIRIQDQKRIRNLSEQKRQLENKMEIKQAQNIVLKQIKHYYQKKNEIMACASQMSLTDTEFKKPQTVLIMRRNRRFKTNHYEQHKRESEDENETNADIRKMRKYLQRCREANTSQREEQAAKAKPKQTSRNYACRSVQA